METVSLLRMRRVHVALLTFFGLVTNFMLRWIHDWYKVCLLVHLFFVQGQHHLCYRVYDQVGFTTSNGKWSLNTFSYEWVSWSHKPKFRPTNDSPVVAWSLDQKESLKSAFFIGYVIMQVITFSKHLLSLVFLSKVPGGRLAEMFGTKRIFGINM